MARFRPLHAFRLTLSLVVLLSVLAVMGSASAAGAAGAVYTLSNSPAGNEVLIFARAGDGSLMPAGSIATGGLGSGAGLGSQGAVILSRNGRWLFAVNAGSNDISVFRVSGMGLSLVDRVGSGGTMPISLTLDGDLLYVLNAGGSGNISGFTVGNDGSLTPLAGSTRPLSNNGIGPSPGPAQVSFSPDGRVLVVTEKATNLISTYVVDPNGLATGPMAQPSSGATPFGFAFDKRGHLIVSEAFGGAPDASAVSSYDVAGDGTLSVVSPTVGTTETAACWVVVTKNGKYAYASNTGSQSISGYAVGHNGSLTLLDADGKTGDTGAGTAPIDMALSNNSRYLYVLNGGASPSIGVFAVNADGSLTSLGTTGIPAGAVGLASK